jgi:cation:H+ antiporter
MLISFLFFIIACIGIVGSTHFLVKSLFKVEEYYHLREFIVGFLLIGILTSLPELSVGIISALNQISSLSFGNVIGANVVDVALVVGLVAFISKNIKVEAQLEKSTLFIITAMTFLPLILFLDQELSRIDGAILIVAFFLYVVRLLHVRKKFKSVKKGKVTKRELHKDIIIFIISLAILIASARLIVYAASNIAAVLSFPLILIGLLIVSPGTSLPELSFELSCVLKKHSSVALGDLLGSLAFNSTFILGVVSVISPIKAHFSSFSIGSIFFIISLFMFLIFARTGKEIRKKEGAVLLIIYALFVIITFYLNS